MDENDPPPTPPLPAPPAHPNDAGTALPEVEVVAGERPMGITVLAIMNILFGVMGLLGAITVIAILPFWDWYEAQMQILQTDPNIPEWSRKINAMTAKVMNKTTMIASGILGSITGVLLIVSGIGYFKQKKTMGRFVGNVYAVVALIGFVLGLFLWNFGLLNATELIFPLITLVLINFTFREDFVH